LEVYGGIGVIAILTNLPRLGGIPHRGQFANIGKSELGELGELNE